MLFIYKYIVRYDTVLLHRLAYLLSEQIISCLCNKDHPIAIACRRNGLIGPLASGVHEEIASQNSLTSCGQVRCLDNHVGIAAAYDYNIFHLKICFCKDSNFQANKKGGLERSASI